MTTIVLAIPNNRKVTLKITTAVRLLLHLQKYPKLELLDAEEGSPIEVRRSYDVYKGANIGSTISIGYLQGFEILDTYMPAFIEQLSTKILAALLHYTTNQHDNKPDQVKPDAAG